MLTRNYYTFIRQAAFGTGSSGLAAKDYTGISRSLYGYTRANMEGVFPDGTPSTTLPMNIASSPSNNKPVMIGSGNTKPTLDDYKLEKMITSGVTVNSTGADKIFTDEGVVVTNSYMITNTLSAAITVGEIGYFGRSYYGGTNNQTYFLMDRTLLDEPITIPAGGQAQIQYTLNFKLPVIPE